MAGMDWLVGSNVLVALAVCAAAALSTVLGSLFVIFSKEPSPRLLAFGLAFAGGAMVYVSLVEIFWKAEQGFAQLNDPKSAYIYATIAFFAGALTVSGASRRASERKASCAQAASRPSGRQAA